MNKLLVTAWAGVLTLGLIAPAQAYMLYKGDGSDEAGFVSPRQGPPPPPPPSHIASGETFIPFPGPPATSMARSEKKNPPNPPVLFCKIKSQYGALDWAARPNDVNNLLKSMKSMMNVNFSMECKDIAEIDTNPERNPILYRTGHFHFKHDDLERKRLREYLLNGGMIIYDAGMGSKPFYDSAKEELAAIFPETPVHRLSPDHPIFHAYYDLDHVQYRAGVRKALGAATDEPWLEGVSINCRVVAVVSRWGLGIGWDAVNDDSLQGYSVESAQKLGVNLMSYATAQRAWTKQLAQSLELVDQSTVSAGKVSLVQVIYDGEWKTRHKGLSILLHQFNQKTDIPVKFGLAERRLSDPRIFDAPLIYMTGHEDFQLSATERANLRQYLKNGGLLFAEACCGRKAFDMAFRRELRKVLPDQTLVGMLGGSIFSLPNKIDVLGITPSLVAHMGNKSMIEPKLETIDINNHHSVIYSPYGLAGGWEMSPNPYGWGYDEAGSLALGENILLYAVTQ